MGIAPADSPTFYARRDFGTPPVTPRNKTVDKHLFGDQRLKNCCYVSLILRRYLHFYSCRSYSSYVTCKYLTTLHAIGPAVQVTVVLQIMSIITLTSPTNKSVRQNIRFTYYTTPVMDYYNAYGMCTYVNCRRGDSRFLRAHCYR